MANGYPTVRTGSETTRNAINISQLEIHAPEIASQITYMMQSFKPGVIVTSNTLGNNVYFNARIGHEQVAHISFHEFGTGNSPVHVINQENPGRVNIDAAYNDNRWIFSLGTNLQPNSTAQYLAEIGVVFLNGYSGLITYNSKYHIGHTQIQSDRPTYKLYRVTFNISIGIYQNSELKSSYPLIFDYIIDKLEYTVPEVIEFIKKTLDINNISVTNIPELTTKFIDSVIISILMFIIFIHTYINNVLSSDTTYTNKYLKYKKKYITLRNQKTD